MANLYIIVSSVLLVVALANALPAHDGSIWDTAAAGYSNAWGLIAPDSAKEACKSVGYGRPIPKTKVTRALFDAIIPSQVSAIAGKVHGEAVAESMKANFCAEQGLGKDIPAGQQVQVQIPPKTQTWKWTIQQQPGSKGNVNVPQPPTQLTQDFIAMHQ